jgi:hypothetical protein
MPCLVPIDGGGAPYNLNFALCIPKANSSMCICYGGALSLFIKIKKGEIERTFVCFYFFDLQ